MEKIYRKARAKVNLTLEVLEKRPDHYHNIRSIFQKVSLYDEIYLEKRVDQQFWLETNQEELNNTDNIIYKAYQKLKGKCKRFGWNECKTTQKNSDASRNGRRKHGLCYFLKGYQ